MLQDEYYVIEGDKSSCLLSWDEQSASFGMGKPVNVTEPINVRIAEPIQDTPKMVDYHEMPEPVVSQRIADALIPLDIYGIQLVPAKVRNPKDPFSEPHDYWFIHIWNSIHCLDKDSSELEISQSGNTIFGIDKLVLNDEVLRLFELRKRLVFELAEDASVLLVHESVKDAIMSTAPVGCRFFKATEWNSDITFE